jgi:hypothetical protein
VFTHEHLIVLQLIVLFYLAFFSGGIPDPFHLNRRFRRPATMFLAAVRARRDGWHLLDDCRRSLHRIRCVRQTRIFIHRETAHLRGRAVIDLGRESHQALHPGAAVHQRSQLAQAAGRWKSPLLLRP